MTVGISKVTKNGSSLNVEWKDGEKSNFNFMWLRDNCPCCVHPYTLEQTYEVVNAPKNLRPAEIEVASSGALAIEWEPEDHKSIFHPGWLKKHCYSNQPPTSPNMKSVSWDSSTRAKPDEYNWEKIIRDEEVELQWLQSVQISGCALVHGVPQTDPGVGEVAKRIGVVRHSNFGDLFDVRVDFDPVSNSNTGLELPPHTDLPTREYQPGMQLLHCIKNNVKGGNSILVDGFRVAEELQERHPRACLLYTSPSPRDS